MTTAYLLDTDILSEPLRPRPNARLMRRLERHQDVVATSALSWHEMLYGAARLPDGKRRRALDAYLRDVVHRTLAVLPYGQAAAAWHAVERARLEKAGLTRPFVDGQIAAIAAVNDLVLVTRNLRDFQPFRDVEVIDWTR